MADNNPMPEANANPSQAKKRSFEEMQVGNKGKLFHPAHDFEI